MVLYLVGVVVAAIVLLLIGWYRTCYAPYQVYKSSGLPQPPLTPFFGNTLQLVNQGYLECVDKWITKYGKILIYYVGANPTIMVADPDMLKEITIKHFNKFTDRQKFDPFKGVRGKFPPGLLVMQGKEWKQTRAIITPTFSTKKLKTMIPLIEKSCVNLNEKIKGLSEGNQSIEMWRIFGQFTMETVLATAFGCQVNILKGEGNELTEAAAGIFSNLDISFLLLLLTLKSQFPFLQPFLSLIFSRSKINFCTHQLQNISLQILKARKQMTDVKYNDYLQLLIEAKADDSEELSSATNDKKTLTDEEIVSLSNTFLLAGYETTSNCLAYTAYLLAINTDKQDKLRQCIEDYYQENEDTQLYDASHNIEYLDWVINESLRMYPPGPRTARNCTETCTINGIKFIKDTEISIPIQSLHYSSEYWDEPDVFRPERFSPEEKEGRHPLCYMPFGWGPRNCVGMRFALMEAKMALVNILRDYKFEVAPDTQIPLKLKLGITQFPADGIFLNVRPVKL